MGIKIKSLSSVLTGFTGLSELMYMGALETIKLFIRDCG
jgi:hypothetical protein